MDIKVISQYRALLFPCLDIGTVTENKATTLHFIIPQEMNKYPDRKVVLSNSTGSYLFPLVNDSFEITNIATLSPTAEIQLVCTNSNGDVWKSKPYTVNFYSSVDDSGESVFDDMKKQWTAEAQRPLTIFVNYLTEMFESFKTKGGNDK